MKFCAAGRNGVPAAMRRCFAAFPNPDCRSPRMSMSLTRLSGCAVTGRDSLKSSLGVFDIDVLLLRCGLRDNSSLPQCGLLPCSCWKPNFIASCDPRDGCGASNIAYDGLPGSQDTALLRFQDLSLRLLVTESSTKLAYF